MAWVKMKGGEGLVYVPDEPDPRSRKHNCPDCYACQHCSDERCRLCLKHKKGTGCCRKRK
jgi:hypothetical protein